MPRKNRSQKTNSGTPPLFKHQIDSVKFMNTRARVLDSSDPGCVSCDTEFLTPLGWKRIDQYEPGDLVAQFHPHTATQCHFPRRQTQALVNVLAFGAPA